MNFRRRPWRAGTLAALCLLAALPLTAQPEPVPFRTAIETALKRSGLMVTAGVDREHAQHSLEEVRAAYLPQLTLGSGIGYTRGVPLSMGGNAPSLFSLTSTQFLLNFAQRDLLRAARIDLRSSQADYADKAMQVMLDAGLLYLEFDSLSLRLKSLHDEQQFASRATFITGERVREGLDSQLENKRAQLAAARVEMRLAEAEGRQEVVRAQLARLLGVPAENVATATDSIPPPPEITQDDSLAGAAVEHSAAVRGAEEHVRAAQLRASAERKQNLPAIDFATQYQMLSTYNNYDQYYKSFTRNNVTVGAVIRFPFMNFAQRARQRAAEAEVTRARNDAITLRAQVSDEAVRLQRKLRELRAALDVARLEYEVAQANIDVVQAHLQSGQTNSRDVENARLDAANRNDAYLAAQFELTRATLQLLRQTGGIESWALGAKP